MVSRSAEAEITEEEKSNRKGEEEKVIEGYVSKAELVNYLEGLKVQREIIMRGMVHGTFNHWYTQGAIRSIEDLIAFTKKMSTYEIGR